MARETLDTCVEDSHSQCYREKETTMATSDT